VQVCSKCGKENQNHYKFCLGCGNEMPPELEAAQPDPTPAPAPTPTPAATPAATPTPAPAPAPMAPAPPASVSPTPPAGVPRVSEEPTPLVTPRDEPPGPALQPVGTELATPNVQEGLRPSRPSGVQIAPPQEPAAKGSQSGAAVAPVAAQKEPAKIYCTACGAANPREFVFCGGCGAKLKKPMASTDFYGGAAPPDAAADPQWGRLCLIKPDGSMGGTFTLQGDEVALGREAGELFAHDGYLSPLHARLVREGGEVILEDSGSLNGVFIKITGEETLADGDIFRLGQELLRFDVVREPEVLEDGTEIMGSPNPDYWGRLSLIAGPDIDGSAFPLMGDEVILGRERGDILFPDDGYVSGIHAKISITEAGFILSDLGSSNGTFLRLIEPRPVSAGTYILMGQQLFLMEMD